MRKSKFFAAAVIRILFIAVFAIFWFDVQARAQNLSAQEIETSVAKIAKLVESNYVFPDKGKTIAAHFLSEHRRGKFAGTKDWQAFGKTATGILRGFSNDGHLFVEYDPPQVRELTTPPADATAPDAESSFFYGKKARESNYGFSEVKVLDGNIGYLKLTQINISEKSLPILFAAMRLVAGTQALLIDLRDNGGGGSEIGAVLESFFLPKNTALLEFKSRSGSVETSKTVAWLTEKRYEQPLYLIVNRKTASAAEAFAFALQAKKRAVVVGQASAGGANMSSWYPVNEFLYVSVSTAAPVLPGTEKSWEGRGVQPDFLTAAGREVEFITRQIIKK